MTVITRKGRQVDSPHTDAEAIERLCRYVVQGKLKGDFPASLARQAEEGRRPLSEEQVKWCHILVVEEDERPPVPEAQVVGGTLARVYDLFAMARQHLEYPKVRLVAIQDGIDGHYPADPPRLYVKLYIAGQRSKYAGQVMVVENHPDRVTQHGVPGVARQRWLGHIDTDGTYHPSRQIGAFRMEGCQSELEALVGLLQRFVDNPAEVAGEQGRFMGACCFCGQQLTDERSIGVGYGPTCAEHYCLPWGKPKKKKEVE
jgi:hypothetical protein